MRGLQHRWIQIRQRAVKVSEGIRIGCFGEDLCAETLLRDHAAQEIEGMQAIARRARGNKCGQISVQLFLARFFTLYVAGHLASHSFKQTPIALIETIPQSQQQDPNGATFVRKRNRDRLERVDRSGSCQLNFFFLKSAITEFDQLPPDRSSAWLDCATGRRPQGGTGNQIASFIWLEDNCFLQR